MYVGSRRQVLTKKQRRRQLQVANGLAPPSQGEVRFSSRTANKVTNYNLDDDEDDELEELAITPNYYNAADDDTPAIDIVLDHEIQEGKGEFLLNHVETSMLIGK